MKQVMKSRLLWLVGGFSLLMFGLSVWAAIGFAFALPEPSMGVRIRDSILALLFAGICAFVSAATFVKSGFTEYSKVTDAMPVRVYLIGVFVLGLGFVIFWY